ncbi:MAG: hypothetical protein FWG99_11670 [Treponema sp.]|nr:hypothetical protein [Treponema sp.]
MARFLSFLLIAIVSFTISCNRSSNQPFPIDGHYVNDEFDIYKITSTGKDTATLEIFSHRVTAGWNPMLMYMNIIGQNPVQMQVDISNGGYLLKDPLSQPGENDCFIYKEDDDVYMEMGMAVYRKTELPFDQETHHRISAFLHSTMGLRYDQDNQGELWMVKPQYPEIFTAKIIIDDAFRVLSVEEGRILFQDNRFIIMLPSSEFYVNDAMEFSGSLFLHDLYLLFMASGYDVENFTAPQPGDYLYEALYKAENFEIEEESVNADYDLISMISEGTIIQFPNFSRTEETRKWIFDKNKMPVSTMPVFGSREILDYTITSDTEMHVKLMVDNEKEQRHYTANFIFKKGN